MGRAREARKTAGNSKDDSSKNNLGCSSTTSNNTVLRAELGMYPLKTKSDVRKSKCQYKVRNMPKRGLPGIVDRAVWEKATKR